MPVFQSPRAIWPPEPGLFSVRLAKGAWAVPAQILHTEDGWQAEVDGVLHAPHSEPEHAYMVSTVWHSGTMIDPVTYDWLGAVREHARQNDPEHPSLHPRERINMMRIKPLHPGAV